MGWIMFPPNPQRVGHKLATKQQQNSHVQVLNPVPQIVLQLKTGPLKGNKFM